ncbi:MAG TPA: acyl-CoA dehydrogenase family protein [Burkholderiales bacterium]|nr:acyl-CoA dehydrogenase family protein [Burkholderiales bacterium]
MSETRALLTETAGRMFGDLCTRECSEAAEAGTWPEALWQSLSDTGIVAAAVSEARGGAGAEPADLYALARVLGYHAAPVPLVETWLGEQMLASAGLPPIEGPTSVGPVLRRDTVRLERHGAGWTLTGTLKRVPWGRDSTALVLAAEADGGARTLVISRQVLRASRWKEGWSYAREPRDEITFDGLRISDDCVAPAKTGWGRGELFFRGALFRTQQMAGAMERTLELTVAYAKERVQFGRVIGKFQAVQQQIAALASQVAAASACAQGAAEANAHGLSRFEIAAAKARIGEAVATVAGVAHQVHAAIGFTHEHALHRSTRRLWSWRDEFGTETEWQAWVGAVAAQLGGEGLWPYVVTSRKADLGVALP